MKVLWVWTLATERTTEELNGMEEHLRASMDAARDAGLFDNGGDPRGE